MRTVATLFSFTLLMLLVACSPKKNEPPQPKTEVSPWNLFLETQPEKPEMNKAVVFRLTMTDKQGQPVAGAQVRGSLVMPLMDMGKNEFPLADKGKGVYEGTGKMDMAGPWEVVVVAKVGSVEGKKTFELAVRE